MEHMNFINDMVARGLQHLYLTNMNVLCMSFKKRSVIHVNHRDKSLNKNAINEITSLYKYCHKKLRFLKEAHKRFKKLNLLSNFSPSCLIVGGTMAGRINNESHCTLHYTW